MSLKENVALREETFHALTGDRILVVRGRGARLHQGLSSRSYRRKGDDSYQSARISYSEGKPVHSLNYTNLML